MNKSLKRALLKIAEQSEIHTCPICGQKGHAPEHNSSYGEVIVIDGVTFCRYADFTYPCGCKATIDRQVGN